MITITEEILDNCVKYMIDGQLDFAFEAITKGFINISQLEQKIESIENKKQYKRLKKYLIKLYRKLSRNL